MAKNQSVSPHEMSRAPRTCRSHWLRRSLRRSSFCQAQLGEAAATVADEGDAAATVADEGEVLASPDVELTDRVRAYLRANLDASVSVAELAAAVFVSPRTLQRALKRVLGHSPKEEILAVKMEESRRLLTSGALRVNEVAYRVGFVSADHFSRRFKSYHGVTPSSVIPC